MLIAVADEETARRRRVAREAELEVVDIVTSSTRSAACAAHIDRAVPTTRGVPVLDVARDLARVPEWAILLTADDPRCCVPPCRRARDVALPVNLESTRPASARLPVVAHDARPDRGESAAARSRR